MSNGKLGAHACPLSGSSFTLMKHSGRPLVEGYCVTSCGVLRQHHHAARPFIARSSIPRSRRHCRKTVAVVDESSDLAAAELAHRLRSLARAALDSARRMAGQQPSG